MFIVISDKSTSEVSELKVDNKMPSRRGLRPKQAKEEAKNQESSDDDFVSDDEPPPLAEYGTPPGIIIFYPSRTLLD